MRHVQISRAHHTARARRQLESEQILPTGLRDPDIVRAKQLMKGARFRVGPGQATT
jgi:hypothetical protein